MIRQVSQNCGAGGGVAGLLASVVGARAAPGVHARVAEMLLKPSPDDWLMYSRTYDAQRFSPLKQITKQNVGRRSRCSSTSSATARSEAS